MIRQHYFRLLLHVWAPLGLASLAAMAAFFMTSELEPAGHGLIPIALLLLSPLFHLFAHRRDRERREQRGSATSH